MDIDLSGESDWTDMEQFRAPLARPFVSADPDPERFRVRYYTDPLGNLAARAWFGPHCEGPPGHAHGGSVAAVLDEAMGGNCWVQGHAVLAGTLTIKYRRPLPLGSVVTVRTAVDRVEGRKVFAVGRLLDASGAVVAEGEGTFIVMREELQGTLDAEARKAGRTFGSAY